MAVRTQQEIYDELKGKRQAGFDETVEQQRAAKDEWLASTLETIDESAAQASGVYQKRIDSSDAQYKTQYADNAVQEAFNRQQIKEAMANSGMTDSGYNRTMQTALTLNRSRQDAAVTADKQSYVQKLQDAIDSVMTQAAAEKKTQTLTAEQNFDTWLAEATNTYEDNLWDDATAIWTTETEAETERIKSDNELKMKELELSQKANDDLIDSLIDAGYDVETAYAIAGAAYTTGDSATDTANQRKALQLKNGWSDEETEAYFDGYKVDGKLVEVDGKPLYGYDAVNAYREAQDMTTAGKLIGGQNLLGGANSGWDWLQTRAFKTDQQEASSVISEVTKELKKRSNYKKATDSVKEYMLGYAVANAMKSNRGSNTEIGKMLPILEGLLSEKAYAALSSVYKKSDDTKTATTQPTTQPTTSVYDRKQRR